MTTSSREEPRTYECPHCGGESFGLVVEDCSMVYARCKLCETVVLDA